MLLSPGTTRVRRKITGKTVFLIGYENIGTGKTAGSRVAFMNPESKHIIKLHKPHPRPELKRYQLDYVEEALRNKGVIQ